MFSNLYGDRYISFDRSFVRTLTTDGFSSPPIDGKARSGESSEYAFDLENLLFPFALLVAGFAMASVAGICERAVERGSRSIRAGTDCGVEKRAKRFEC